jgi:hypothetical protein
VRPASLTLAFSVSAKVYALWRLGLNSRTCPRFSTRLSVKRDDALAVFFRHEI